MPFMTRGTEKPLQERQRICRHQTALTLIDVGVAALCPGRETKGVAANSWWFFQHPDSSVSHAGVVSFSGCAMPLIDYSKVLTFPDSVEALSITLHHALVKLRDQVAYGPRDDFAMMRAAEHLSALLEDGHKEVERLIAALERK
jgi:hypothetical protein